MFVSYEITTEINKFIIQSRARFVRNNIFTFENQAPQEVISIVSLLFNLKMHVIV